MRVLKWIKQTPIHVLLADKDSCYALVIFSPNKTLIIVFYLLQKY